MSFGDAISKKVTGLDLRTLVQTVTQSAFCVLRRDSVNTEGHSLPTCSWGDFSGKNKLSCEEVDFVVSKPEPLSRASGLHTLNKADLKKQRGLTRLSSSLSPKARSVVAGEVPFAWNHMVSLPALWACRHAQETADFIEDPSNGR